MAASTISFAASPSCAPPFSPTHALSPLSLSISRRSCTPRSPYRALRTRAQTGNRHGTTDQENAVAGSHGKQLSVNGGDDVPSAFLDRRELMAASVAGLSMLSDSPLSALAKPLPLPDLSSCVPATVSSPSGSGTSTTVQCCLPVSKKAPVVFSPGPAMLPPRKIRRPAHLAALDTAYVEKYNKAYELMMGLSPDDPRSFKQQADVHCAFCNGAYTLPNSTTPLQIHFSWIFLPWHRWYLYFHEKILGSLIGDPNFALPYWNWDEQTLGNVIPSMFLQKTKYPALYDANRNQSHLPPTLTTLNISDMSSESTLSNKQIIEDNLSIMYQSVVQATTASIFMGTAPLFEDLTTSSAQGTLESLPHTAIHAWTGDPDRTYGEDMGNFYSAGRDPIFYCHHSNVDRLWMVWNNLGGRRKDHMEPDFLNSQFLFYDEKAQLVKVSVKDALDSAALGVAYEPAKGDAVWQNVTKPILGVKGVVPKSVDALVELGPASKDKSATEVTEKLTTLVARPAGTVAEFAKARGLKEEEVEEVLVLQDVQVPTTALIHLAVFINLPEADAKTPLNSAEYVGSFANLPHVGMMDMSSRKVNARFAILDALKKLGIEDQSKVAVTVVARGPKGTQQSSLVSVAGFLIEYE